MKVEPAGSEPSSSSPLPGGPAPDRPSGRYPNIDGLRAIAALSVVVFHVATFTDVPAHTSAASLLLRLNNGVSVFFVISGFLIYRPFVLAQSADRPEPGLRMYAVRRALRIYPAWWLAMAGTALLFDYALLPDLGSVVLQAALLQDYLPSRAGSVIPQAWTLVVEVSFYAFLPLYAWAIGRLARRIEPLRAQLVGIVALLAFLPLELWVASANTTGKLPAPSWLFVLPRQLPIFALGILLAVASAPWPRRPRPLRFVDWLGAHPAISWSIAGAVFLARGALLGRSGPGSWDLVHHSGDFVTAALVGFFLVAPAAAGPQNHGRIRGFLRTRPLVYLGTVSYGIYLWHYTVLTWIRRDLLPDVGVGARAFVEAGLLCVFITVLIASVSWYLLERPLLHLVHRSRPTVAS